MMNTKKSNNVHFLHKKPKPRGVGFMSDLRYAGRCVVDAINNAGLGDALAVLVVLLLTVVVYLFTQVPA